MDWFEVRDLLNAKRKALGMPVEAVARRSGLSASQVYRVLNGPGGNRLANAIAVAEALGITFSFEDAKKE